MDFLDVMGSRVLSEREIWEHSEEVLAGQVPPTRERILMRLAVGTLFADWAVKAGMLPPEAAPHPATADVQEVMGFFMAAQEAGALAAQIRAQNDLLIAALGYEAAQQQLLIDPHDAFAQAEIKGVSEDTLALVKLRNHQPEATEPDPDPQPEAQELPKSASEVQP